MKRPFYLKSLLLLVLVAALLSACGGSNGAQDFPGPANTPDPAANATFPLTVTDSEGFEVVIAEPPLRIVSYSPAATEILFAVGAGERVVAVDQFSNFPAEVASLPDLDYSSPAPEPAIDLEPDLVIMVTQQEGQVSQFRDVGLTVLFLREPADLAGVLDQIRLLGRVTDRADAANELAGRMQDKLDAIAAAVSAIEEGPTVFYELTPDLFTVAPDTFIGSMFTLLKARNVAEGSLSSFPQLSPETLIDRDPDVILLADAGDSGGQSPETVRARPGWSGIAAVRTDRVFIVDADVHSRPGPRIVDALGNLLELLYPEISLDD